MNSAHAGGDEPQQAVLFIGNRWISREIDENRQIEILRLIEAGEFAFSASLRVFRRQLFERGGFAGARLTKN